MYQRFILSFLLLCIMILRVYAESPPHAHWNFSDLNGWVYAHQDNNPESQCDIRNGKLHIFTRAGSDDRKKVRTNEKIYTTGRYTWKTYIPRTGKGDRTSIGSWIYCDDLHEIDFEVGYGTKEVRKKLKARRNDMIAYMTTQGEPFSSIPIKLRAGWHVFELDLTLVDGRYLTTWIIDGNAVKQIHMNYGEEIRFFIFCSVENLRFIGDHSPARDNYGQFDYVSYTYHE